MGLSKKNQIKLAKGVGIAWAENLFADFMRSQEFRGSSFTWEKFPKMCKGMACANCFASFPHRIAKEIKDIAGRASYKRAKELVFTLPKDNP